MSGAVDNEQVEMDIPGEAVPFEETSEESLDENGDDEELEGNGINEDDGEYE
jgi:hypothetical protein